jgi:hypothetical protein
MHYFHFATLIEFAIVHSLGGNAQYQFMFIPEATKNCNKSGVYATFQKIPGTGELDINGQEQS